MGRRRTPHPDFLLNAENLSLSLRGEGWAGGELAIPPKLGSIERLQRLDALPANAAQQQAPQVLARPGEIFGHRLRPGWNWLNIWEDCLVTTWAVLPTTLPASVSPPITASAEISEAHT